MNEPQDAPHTPIEHSRLSTPYHIRNHHSKQDGVSLITLSITTFSIDNNSSFQRLLYLHNGHTFATVVLRDLMGHKSIRTTLRYAEVNPERTREAFRSFDREVVRR